MLSIYTAAMIFGGVFLLLSLVGGGEDGGSHHGDLSHGDAGDFHSDTHLDEHNASPDELHPLSDHHSGSPLGGSLMWFPFISMRFWVFALSFGGLAGLMLELFATMQPMPAGLLAAFTGYLTGTAAVNILSQARRSDVTTSMNMAEMVGLEGVMVLPLEPGGIGKVRVSTRSGMEELMALASPGFNSPIAMHARVRITGFSGHRALVQPA